MKSAHRGTAQFYPSQPKLYAKIPKMAPMEAASITIDISIFCLGVSSFRGTPFLWVSVSNLGSFNLPLNNSSADIPNASARTGKLDISGLPEPVSLS